MTTKHFCLQCDDGTELVHERRDLRIHADEYVDNVAQVSGWHCPVCDECEFDAGEGVRYAQALAALRAKANEQRAAAIRATRKKLGLRQAEAGRLFGGGASAFSEYERNKTQPHKAMVMLFKLLDKHPELLEEIRA